jgi:anti-anti-sigma factor
MEHPAAPRSDLTVSIRNGTGGDDGVLVLNGELDVQTMHTLRSYIMDSLRRDHRRIRLDMAGVTRCEGGALHGIVGLQDALGTAGGHLRVSSASEAVREARTAVRLPHGIFGMDTPG